MSSNNISTNSFAKITKPFKYTQWIFCFGDMFSKVEGGEKYRILFSHIYIFYLQITTLNISCIRTDCQKKYWITSIKRNIKLQISRDIADILKIKTWNLSCIFTDNQVKVETSSVASSTIEGSCLKLYFTSKDEHQPINLKGCK